MTKKIIYLKMQTMEDAAYLMDQFIGMLNLIQGVCGAAAELIHKEEPDLAQLGLVALQQDIASFFDRISYPVDLTPEEEMEVRRKLERRQLEIPDPPKGSSVH